MPFSTVLEVTLETSYASQVCINRFNYLGIALTEENPNTFSEALTESLGYVPGDPPAVGSVFAALVNPLSVSVAGISLTAFDPWNPIDYLSLPLEGWQGTGTGDALSPIVALGFKSARTRRDINRSTKRFTGVPESYVGTGGALTGGGNTAVSAMALALGRTLEVVYAGIAYQFFPITVSKEKYAVPGTSPVRYAYRYYTTRIAQLDRYAMAENWASYAQVRSQVSRQYGSGR